MKKGLINNWLFRTPPTLQSTCSGWNLCLLSSVPTSSSPSSTLLLSSTQETLPSHIQDLLRISGRKGTWQESWSLLSSSSLSARASNLSLISMRSTPATTMICKLTLTLLCLGGVLWSQFRNLSKICALHYNFEMVVVVVNCILSYHIFMYYLPFEVAIVANKLEEF